MNAEEDILKAINWLTQKEQEYRAHANAYFVSARRTEKIAPKLSWVEFRTGEQFARRADALDAAYRILYKEFIQNE